MSLARSFKEGVHPTSLDNIGGFQQGNVALYDVPNSNGDYQVKLPTGSAPWLSAPAGIQDNAGFVGGTGTSLGEALLITRQGLTRALLSANLTTTRGGELIADSGTLGNVQPRTAYSYSAWILGWAEEAYGPSSTADLVEMYAQPFLKEIVRTVPLASSATFTAATKYLQPGYTSLSSTAVVVYTAQFTGQVLRNLVGSVQTAPSSTNTVTFTIYRAAYNSATQTYGSFTATTITCVITGGTGLQLIASDTTHTVTLNQGDLIAVAAIGTDTTAALPSCSFDVT